MTVRPRSDDKRKSILDAATRIIAGQGLSAPTATIARDADISNGSLFTYFDTKADLLNHLYLELKNEMASAALGDLPADADVRAQLLHVWTHWLRWASANPEKRRTLAHLDVCDVITPASREIAKRAMTRIGHLLERGREHGPMQDAPIGLLVALATALADATTDFMIRDRERADEHSRTAFDALWRMIA